MPASDSSQDFQGVFTLMIFRPELTARTPAEHTLATDGIRYFVGATLVVALPSAISVNTTLDSPPPSPHQTTIGL